MLAGLVWSAIVTDDNVASLPFRLRQKYANYSFGSNGPPILLEAANEIERLRRELQRAQDEMNTALKARSRTSVWSTKREF
jgi:hypothetical protein